MADRAPHREDDLEIKGPLGWSIRANGKQVVSLVVILAMGGVFLWMLRDHDMRVAEQMQVAALDRKTIVSAQVHLQESLDTIVYVMSLSPEKREELKLTMPPALRDRLLRDERFR